MGLETSLLGIMASILVWVVQKETGGVMNIVFRPANIPLGSNVTEFDIESDLGGAALKFVTSMLLYKELDLPVLAAISADLGGGPRAVDEANKHPNREPTIFWCTIGTFGVVLVLIIVIQLINCCCCCCGGPGETYSNLQQALIEKTPDNKQGHLICRVVYIVLLVMALAFGVACVILIGVYFGSTGLALTFLENHENTSDQAISLPNGIRALAKHVTAFMKTGISEGERITNTTLEKFVTTAEIEVGNELGKAIDDIIVYLQVGSIQQKGQIILNEIGKFEVKIQSTQTHAAKLKTKVDQLATDLTKVQEDFKKAFDKVPNCQAECTNLKNAIAALKLPFNSSSFESPALNTFLGELQKTVTKMKSQLQKVQAAIENVRATQKDMVDSLIQQLNIRGQLGGVNDFWKSATSQLGGVESKLDIMVSKMEQQLPSFTNYIAIGLYVIGGIFILMTTISVLICGRLVFRGIKMRLYSSVHVDASETKLDRVICGKGAVCCCSVFFIPILLIFAAIVAVLLFVLTLTSGEACIYIARDSAISKTDFVVNGVLAKKWPSIVGNLSSEFLDLPAPNNLLNALTNTCSPDSKTSTDKGLLAALGYSNIVNFTTLLKSPAIQDAINKGEESAVNQIRGLDIISKLPEGAEIQVMIQGLEDAVKALSLSAIINALDPNIVDNAASSFASITKQVDAFVKNLPDRTPGKADLAAANGGMKRLSQNSRDIRPDFANTQAQVQNIADTKDSLLIPVKEVSALVTETRNLAAEPALTIEVKNQYRKVSSSFLNTLGVEGNASFTKLTKELFPCKEAYKAMTVMTAVTCGDAGVFSRLTAAIYVLSLNILFITLFYFSLFNLAFVQALQARQFNFGGGSGGGVLVGSGKKYMRNDISDDQNSSWSYQMN